MTTGALNAIREASTDKVNVGLGVGGLVIFAAWLVDSLGGAPLTAEAAIGLSTGLTWLVQRLWPDSPTVSVVNDETGEGK